MLHRVAVIAITVVLSSCGSRSSEPIAQPASPNAGPPPARAVPFTETVFGIELDDPYRWMESGEHEDELHAWMRVQNDYTRSQLDPIVGLQALRAELRELSMGASQTRSLTRRGARLFYKRTAAGENIAKLYVQDGDAAPVLLLDPDTLADGDEHAAIDNFTPSPDGTLVTVNVSRGGAEITTIIVIDVDTRATLPDQVAPVWGEFYANWLPDSSGFFYTQMSADALDDPAVDEMTNMQVRFHAIGSSADSDPALLGADVPGSIPIAAREFPIVLTPVGSTWALGLGVGARSEVRLAVAPTSSLLEGQAQWTMVAEYEDLVEGFSVAGDQMYLLTTNGAPNGTVLRVDLAAPVLANATVVVPESERVIKEMGVAKDALWVVDMVSGSAGLRSIDLATADQRVHDVPPGTTLWLNVADPRDDGVLLGYAGWVRAFGYVSATHAGDGLDGIGISDSSTVDLSTTKVEAFEVPSTGGAAVPLTVLSAANTSRDGKRPTIVLGYGGYGVTIRPFFNPALKAWLDRGGVYAICNVRGGGAKGRAWFEAGKGKNKPNGIRDFVNCAEFLTREGYTSPDRTAGEGGSMGGVLVGRAITESPESFGAASISVGMLNVIRLMEGPNGANQIPELGDPATEDGFEALFAMDAFHNVVAGTQYPALILKVGMNDKRVAPWMSAKFGARMQASGSRAPIYIRAEEGAGHGIGSTREQHINEQADEWAFLLNQFGHPDFTFAGE
jgi:prolyl oligopeptidase